MDVYRLLVDTVEDYAIFALDVSGRVRSWNAGGRRLKGYAPDEIIGEHFSTFYLPAERAERRPERHLETAARVGRVEDEGWRLRKDGSRFWASVVITALRDEQGTLVGFSKITRDLTERRNAEQQALEAMHRLATEEEARRSAEARATELRTMTVHLEVQAEQLEEQAQELEYQVEEARERASQLALLEAAVNAAGEGVVVISSDAMGRSPRIAFANPAFVRMTGFTEREIIGSSPELLYGSATNAAAARDARERVSGGLTAHGDATLTRRDGSSLLVEWEAAPVSDPGRRDALPHIVSVVRDVTERRALEDQYRQAQKMEAVGRLAGGIAHDFNNLLTIIHGNCQFLLRDLPNTDPRHEDAVEIRDAASRASALTRQLLTFSRQQPLAPTDLDLNDVVRGAESLLRRVLTEDVVLETLLASHLPLVRADAGQLEQALMNLAVNARDAMPDGGMLRIATRVAPNGDGAVLEVTDTGTGMDAATQARIFEPFFTTKAVGRGTGLGLAMVYGLVQQLGGSITVQSSLGVGTRFDLALPRARDGREQTGDAVTPGAVRGRGETILLVEDESALRRVARRVLTDAGYTVVEAPNGDEALAIAEATPSLAMVVTDVIMPGIRGSVLAERLRATRPTLPVLFMSGYTDDVTVERERAERGTGFLQKPFDDVALTRAVRALLDERR